MSLSEREIRHLVRNELSERFPSMFCPSCGCFSNFVKFWAEPKEAPLADEEERTKFRCLNCGIPFVQVLQEVSDEKPKTPTATEE